MPYMRLAVIFIGFFFCLFAKAGLGQSLVEYKVKAAYLYNFTKFINWPEKELDSFRICILGKDPFGSVIDPITKRKALGKPINLVRALKGQDLAQCQIVYVENVNDHARDLNRLKHPGVLTVTSLETGNENASVRFFSEYGGMIGFVIRDGKVKLRIKLSELKKSGLEVSAKLLELVELVKEDGGN